MPTALTVEIILADGTPGGSRMMAIPGRNIKAFDFSRNNIDYLDEHDQEAKVGVYFLFGGLHGKGRPKVYIGESENCPKRMVEQKESKDFWDRAVVFSDKSFMRNHIKYLEHRCLILAKEANRFEIVNTARVNLPHITPATKPVVDQAIDNIQIFLSTIGYHVLGIPENESQADQELFFIRVKGLTATGVFEGGSIRVLKGSEVVLKPTASSGKAVVQLRQEFIKNGTLVEKNGALLFKKDWLFSSPSQASDMVKGNSSNGWDSWKNSKGQDLNAVYRKGKS